jgi:hypothetical protein
MMYAACSVRDIPVAGQRLCGLTWMGQVLWFSDAAFEQIFAVDPHSGLVVHKIDCPGVRTGLTTVGGNLLQVVGRERRLRTVDPDTGKTVDEVANPRREGELCGLEASPAGLWMGYRSKPGLELRSMNDLRLLDSIPMHDDVAGVTVTDRFVAAASHSRALISLVDPARKKVAVAIGVNGNPTGITWDGRRIWYCDYTTVQLRAIEVPGIVI